MDNLPVHADVITRITQLLRDQYGSDFHQYYEGDPLQIPKANLPCVIVEKVAGSISLGATGTDVFESQINIRLVLDKAADIGASDNVDLTERKLRRMVEARDEQTGEYLPGTVLNLLRTKITLGNAVIGKSLDVQYDLQPRTGDLITSEALVSILTTERVAVPNRT